MRGASNGRVSQGQTPRRKVVLILEDNASVGGLIAGLLRQEGYRAVRAWDPQEALRIARGRTPDLILLDLNCFYPNGLDVLQKFRGSEATRQAPIALVTGDVLNLSSDEAKHVADVVRRPFDIDHMLNYVRKALGVPLVEVQPKQFDPQDYFLHCY